MDGPGEYYAEGSKPVRETQTSYDFTYVWNLMNKINKQTRQKQAHRNGEQTNRYYRGEGLGLGGKGEGIKQKDPNKQTTPRHRQQYGDDQRERGVGEAEEGKEGIK